MNTDSSGSTTLKENYQNYKSRPCELSGATLEWKGFEAPMAASKIGSSALCFLIIILFFLFTVQLPVLLLCLYSFCCYKEDVLLLISCFIDVERSGPRDNQRNCALVRQAEIGRDTQAADRYITYFVSLESTGSAVILLSYVRIMI